MKRIQCISELLSGTLAILSVEEQKRLLLIGGRRGEYDGSPVATLACRTSASILSISTAVQQKIDGFEPLRGLVDALHGRAPAPHVQRRCKLKNRRN